MAGASSGLHHDFHDNLYVLLRGRKRFCLFAPAHASRLAPHGRIRHVHANGRIVYEGQGEVLADGSDAVDVADWRRRRAAEQAVAAAERAVHGGDKVRSRPDSPCCPLVVYTGRLALLAYKRAGRASARLPARAAAWLTS